MCPGVRVLYVEMNLCMPLQEIPGNSLIILWVHLSPLVLCLHFTYSSLQSVPWSYKGPKQVSHWTHSDEGPIRSCKSVSGPTVMKVLCKSVSGPTVVKGPMQVSQWTHGGEGLIQVSVDPHINECLVDPLCLCWCW